MAFQALRIPPEVLHLIFGHSDATSLFQCAQICRLWSEVALDSLWKELPNMYPLLRLLVDVAAINYEIPSWHVLRIHEWRASDLERLYLYGRRVRSLTHREWEPVLFHPGAPRIPATLLLEDVTIFTAGSPNSILPNLREIHWGVRTSCSGLLSILPLVGPSLKVLDIDVQCPIVGNFGEPASKVFRVIGYREDVQIERFHWRMHPAYTMGGEGQQTAPVVDFILAQGKSLRAIDVACRHSNLIIQALGRSTMHNDGVRLTNFKAICFEDNIDLEPLLRITSLETLSLYEDMSEPMRELDVPRMGAAWPNMRRLEIADAEGNLQDLAAFAIHMLNLEELTFQLVLEGTRIPGQMVRFQRLRKLDIGSTYRIGLGVGRIDHSSVVEVLAHVCPANAKIWVNAEHGLDWDEDREEGDAFSMEEEGEEADGDVGWRRRVLQSDTSTSLPLYILGHQRSVGIIR